MKITAHSRIGIIGGRGRTGGQFAKLFRELGCRVTVTDRTTRSRNRALFDHCDVVLFSVPLQESVKIMREEIVHATRKDQLILDVSSLKDRQVTTMLRSPGEVIGMHPLFGPFTDPRGQSVILCPGRASKETVASLKRMFGALGLHSMVMSPREHDRLMGIVQVIPHLKSLLMAEVLRSLGADLKKALATCTPTYELELNVIGRFLDDSADLYMPIIFNNPETKKILRTLQRVVNRFVTIADHHDLPAAEASYRSCKRKFAPFLSRARSHSEACIQTLALLSRS